jgi:putative ABC transport system permease protein
MSYLGEAFQSLRTHPLRVALTMFGIVWGIGSVVLLVGLVAGFHEDFRRRMTAAGDRMILVLGGETKAHIAGGTPRRISLTPEDARILKSIPQIEKCIAETGRYGVIVQCGSRTATTRLRGVFPESRELSGKNVEAGRYITDYDITERARVAVLGAKVADLLFPSDSGIGQIIQIGDWPFKVVGTLERIGDKKRTPENPRNDEILIPFPVAALLFMGDNSSTITVQMRESTQDERAIYEMRALLARSKRFAPEETDAVRFIDGAEQIRSLNRLLNGAKLLVGAVGSITLLVGAIGLMNIMLVSVTERTQEIGIRKAAGATRWSILMQFLIEALIITIIGGAGGILWGTLLCRVAGMLPIPQLPVPYVSVLTVVIASAMTVLVGLASGILPAIRAARMQPTDALRAE